jgi:Ethanolamine utilization protein EutJ (predicted chaperonin)
MSPSSQPTHLQVPPLDVGSIVINPHMEVIPVHVEKNIMEDVLLDGGSCVNIIIEDLRKKLRLPIPKPTPLYL